MLSRDVCMKCTNFEIPARLAPYGFDHSGNAKYWHCLCKHDGNRMGVLGFSVNPTSEVPEHCLYKFEQGIAAGMSNEKP
jgi:hypothetical protein